MKAREYCCCAIPLVNSGIYAALIEQLVAGILIGVLSFGTPSIVGAATPSFAPWLFGIVCLVAGAIQILGFLGVAREKPILFRRYITLHSLAIVAAFAIAAAWIIISASKHSTAQSNCLSDFFNTASSTEQSEGETLCNIFPWVDVGIMAGIWVWLAIMHIYLYVVISSYSSAQQQEHIKYDALTNSEGIPMNNRDLWDSTSMTDVMNQPRSEPYGNSVSHPNYAYTQDPGPTPRFNDPYYGDSSDLNHPVNAQAHPAEGFGRRKTPRLTKPNLDM